MKFLHHFLEISQSHLYVEFKTTAFTIWPCFNTPDSNKSGVGELGELIISLRCAWNRQSSQDHDREMPPLKRKLLSCESTLKPIKSLFKRTLKTLNKKPMHSHYCRIINQYKILDFDNYQLFLDVCLIFKVLKGLAPPLLQDFIKTKSSRARTRGDILWSRSK